MKKIIIAYFKIRNAIRYCRKNYNLKREVWAYVLPLTIACTIGFDAWYQSATEPLKYVAETAHADESRPVQFEMDYSTEEARIFLIKQYFPNDWERAIEIFRCESGLMQEKDGKVIQGPTQDYGLTQLHLPSHKKELNRLGLDVMDIEDNVKFASLLFKEKGWSPWVCNDLI